MSTHAHLSVGGELARRYDPQVNRFAAARDDGAVALSSLASLVQAGEQVFCLQAAEIVMPPELTAIRLARGVQMTARSPVQAPRDSRGIIALTEQDAPEMLALATLTEPGPFLLHTHRMGNFFGIRVDGRLVAMAGERFRFAGHTELSGVCTHPDFRGQGFAGQLSRHVAAAMAARGETAFLHAWKDHVAAIALYRKLGFQLRCEVHVAVLERPRD
ncbi:GNAT family N-acetyltransferase [Rhodanobacter sp. TND4EL1]